MKEALTKTEKTIKRFNTTGLIHTLISVGVFVMSVLNWYLGYDAFHLTIQVLSAVTLFNSLIWIICGMKLFIHAGDVATTRSVAKTRLILFISLWFVLTPDILMIILFYLPSLKGTWWINLVGTLSPVLVFIGWFIGKRVGKSAKKKRA